MASGIMASRREIASPYSYAVCSLAPLHVALAGLTGGFHRDQVGEAPDMCEPHLSVPLTLSEVHAEGVLPTTPRSAGQTCLRNFLGAVQSAHLDGLSDAFDSSSRVAKEIQFWHFLVWAAVDSSRISFISRAIASPGQ